MSADALLKFWAVLGPLAAGIGSALFSRYVQVRDRQYSDAREDLRYSREHQNRRDERTVTHRLQTYTEAKEAYADFMAITHIFVRRQSELMDDLNNPDLKKAALEANEAMMRSCQVVTLLSDDDLEDATIDFLNATLAVPRPRELRNAEWEADVKTYKAARVQFNSYAKRFLVTLRGDVD